MTLVLTLSCFPSSGEGRSVPARLLETALSVIFLSDDLSPGSWGCPGSLFGLPLSRLGLTGQWVQEGSAGAPRGWTAHPPPAHWQVLVEPSPGAPSVGR